MARLQAIPFSTSLAEKLAAGPGADISLYWLGQAGFVLDVDGRRIAIDPYLSDTLATKYRDTPHSHERMMAAPVTADEFGPVDLVLCTHQHTDHLDGATLSLLATRLPRLRFVVPKASEALACERIGIGAERLVTVDAGNKLDMGGFTLTVLRSAHEVLERDAAGHYRFLGYGLDFGGAKIFHSGDTIPFDGQVEEVRAFAPDLALLPINGRSEALRQAGFAGNFTVGEAIDLCSACAIPAMIAHHYGMFAFNTANPEAIDRAAAGASITVIRANEGVEFRLDRN